MLLSHLSRRKELWVQGTMKRKLISMCQMQLTSQDPLKPLSLTLDWWKGGKPLKCKEPVRTTPGSSFNLAFPVYMGMKPLHTLLMGSSAGFLCLWMDWCNMEEYIIPSNNKSDMTYTPPPLSLVIGFNLDLPTEKEVHPDRVNWVMLLPIWFANDRDWTKWENDVDDEGRDCITQKGKKFDFDSPVYYDRKLKWQIHLEEVKIKPGVMDKLDFGFPGPNIQYWSQLQKRWRDEAWSDWL